MKKFTSPDGVFEIDIPVEWDYRNEIVGLENSPPFSFEPFRNSIGCFQVSHIKRRKINIKDSKINMNISKII